MFLCELSHEPLLQTPPANEASTSPNGPLTPALDLMNSPKIIPFERRSPQLHSQRVTAVKGITQGS